MICLLKYVITCLIIIAGSAFVGFIIYNIGRAGVPRRSLSVLVIMVNHVVALFIFATSQMFAAAEDDVASCLELFKPEHIDQNCCELSEMINKEDFESCKTKDGEWECENAKCILDKAGVLSGDTLDEKKVGEMMERFKQKDPDSKAMADRVRSECLGGKYEDYPPKETCPLIRFQICSYINALVECNKWKQNVQCKKLSDHAKTCKSVLDNMKE